MNNKPVAWMLTLPDGTHDWILDGNGCEGYIPLYTHPADLTDEEWVATYMTWCMTSNDPLVLKQAILRKAQEK